MKKILSAITFAALLGAACAGAARGSSLGCAGPDAGAATGTDGAICDGGASGQEGAQEKGEGFREAYDTILRPPTNVSATSTPNAGCSATSGTGNVTISYHVSPFLLGGVVTQPPATCVPGVKVEIVSPLGIRGMIADNRTGSAYADPTPRAIGVEYTYAVTGVCTNGAGGAGSGVANSDAVTATVTPSCVCGAAPVFTNVKINNTSAETIGADYSGLPFLLEGMNTAITGTIVDNGSPMASVTVVLEYGNDLDSPSFPGAQVTAAPSADGRFSINVPGIALKAGSEMRWALWASGTSAACGRANYPATYAGTKETAAVIPGNAIGKGVCPCWTYEPTPSQMPFRAGNGEVLHIRFRYPEAANIVMTLYSPDGRLVRQITSSAGDPELVANICKWDAGCSWDGTTMNGPGNYVPNGLYIMNLSAQTATGLYDNYTKGIVVMK